MKYRKLRIAWSVAWGIACLLLIVLWVRSYWRHDLFNMHRSSSQMIFMGSKYGVIGVTDVDESEVTVRQPGWSTRPSLPPHESSTGFNVRIYPKASIAEFPHWSLLLFMAALASSPWLPWRFSLRTLL